MVSKDPLKKIISPSKTTHFLFEKSENDDSITDKIRQFFINAIYGKQIIKPDISETHQKIDDKSKLIRKLITYNKINPSSPITTDFFDKICNSDKKQIGSGTYGKIFSHDASDQFVIKCVGLWEDENCLSDTTVHELDAISRFRNIPGIVHVDGVYDDDDEIKIIMDKHQMDLSAYCKKHPCRIRTKHVIQFITDMMKILIILSENRTTHFDIKPQNILINENPSGITFTLCDLGFSSTVLYTNRFYRKKCGTYVTSAPELLVNDYNKNNLYPEIQSDVWSVAMTALYMFSKCYEIEGETASRSFRIDCNSIQY